MTPRRDRLNITYGEILDLCLHRVVRLLLFRATRRTAAQRNRMCRADRRGRRHGRHARREGDETACACRRCACWGDIDHHRHRGAEELCAMVCVDSSKHPGY